MIRWGFLFFLFTTALSFAESRIEIVYHICTLNNWEEIVREQLARVVQSGLCQVCDRWTVTVVGAEIQKVHQCFRDFDLFEKTNIIHDGENIQRYEFPALEQVQKIAAENPQTKILYFHSKGVLHYGLMSQLNVRSWRRYMEYFVIDRWKTCLDTLEIFDICGVDWTIAPRGSYFQGNFWWARGEYINTCKLDTEDRWSAEFFIGTGTQPVFYMTFFQSGLSPKVMQEFPHAENMKFYHYPPVYNYRDLMLMYYFDYLEEYYILGL